MKVGDLGAISRAAAALTASTTSNHVVCFKLAASFFEAFEGSTTASFVKKLHALRGERLGKMPDASGAVQVKDLLGAFQDLTHLLQASRANAAVADIQKVLGEFERFESWPLDEYFKRLNMLLTLSSTKVKAQKTTDVIDNYVTSLKAAEASSVKFQEVVDRLQNDKQIKKADLAKVMTAYTGLPAGKKTKPAMISEIKSRFAAEALQSGNVSSLRSRR